MKIYSWNVNGIRSVIRKDLFAPFIEKEKPDILCLQETKAQQDQVDINLTSYMEYWNSAEKAGYSGTAILTKIKPISVSYNLSDDIAKKYTLVDELDRDSNNEGRVLTAEFEKFYIISVYTPNAKPDLSRIPLRHKHWDPAFLAYCKELEQKKPVIFCGDLNVAHTPDDLARPKANEGKKGFTKEEREGFQNFIDAGFIDTFRIFTKGPDHYSWWKQWGNARTNNIGWRIDYFLASESLKPHIKAAEIHTDIMGSDHCPVSITLDM